MEKVMFWTPPGAVELDARADGSQRLAASWRFLLRFLSRAAAGSATKSPAAKSRPATRVARRVMASERGRIIAPALFYTVPL